MKFKTFVPVFMALGLGITSIPAQEKTQVDQLKEQIKTLQENFERTQREQKQQIDALIKQIEGLQKSQSAVSTEQEKLKQEMARPMAETTKIPAIEKSKWSPSDPLRTGSAQNYINLSFDTLLAVGTSTASDIEKLQAGDHDPAQRGITLQGIEVTLDGKIDPFLRGQGNVVLKMTPNGETEVEAEEAFLETMSLPLNLQFKAGHFFSDFGRINTQHAHTWDFLDSPLVLTRLLGPDGLRNPGVRLSWLMPTPFYSELYLAMQNSHGETAFSFRDNHEDETLFGRLHAQGRVKAFNDMLFVPRYVASFDLSDSQTLMAGASAAFGPNGSGADTDTQVYGLDLFWKWKPVNHHAGFPFVTWQTEGMLRRYQAGAFDWDSIGATPGALDPEEQDLDGDGIADILPRETLKDYGFYSQISYGFRKGWVAALRGDYVAGEVAQYETLFGRDPDRGSRWRLSPNLTWYPSEFSKIRLQYNYDNRQGIGEDHSVWLQFEFLLGAHAAHKF